MSTQTQIMEELMTRTLAHKNYQRLAGKYRCTYKRVTTRFTGEIDEKTQALGEGEWVCSECGTLIMTRSVDET